MYREMYGLIKEEIMQLEQLAKSTNTFQSQEN